MSSTTSVFRATFAAMCAALALAAVPAHLQAQTGQDSTGQAQAAEPSPLEGITFGVGFDGYYGWNINRPIGRINLLRAYDVSSDSFSLNQANVIVERAPDVDKGRRMGLRLDLMFGQATETLQGSAANEPRPQAYRNVFQAYGSYVVPVGSGIQIDFGKFASALGFENNYTKDQINYSRSYFFNYLPFYHFGFRSTYAPTERISLTYWLVNGAQQSEDFNGFKSQAAIITVKPTSAISWNINYYAGREARDLNPALNPGLPTLPTQPGLSVDAVTPFDRSRLHIVDTYASWTKGRVLVGAEADYVALRPESGASSTVTGGAAYGQYRVTPHAQVALRYAYFADRSGLFSGVQQNLQDVTATATYTVSDGMMLRGEWRRDSSDQPFFLGPTLEDRRRAQQTLTLGLVWWFGTKRGAW
jgi:hypothetical protein